MKKSLQWLQKKLKSLAETFRIKVIRPFKKRRRRKAFFERQGLIREATGELIEKFEPMLMVMFDETISDYRNSISQNFHTVQACHDIRKLYEIKIKNYIISKK